ncbi:MAG: YwqG family protein [Defluviitaleaceae bacterium]|nr:YwqG family protein [Defluviitaleaceae bacterium]
MRERGFYRFQAANTVFYVIALWFIGILAFSIPTAFLIDILSWGSLPSDDIVPLVAVFAVFFAFFGGIFYYLKIIVGRRRKRSFAKFEALPEERKAEINGELSGKFRKNARPVLLGDNYMYINSFWLVEFIDYTDAAWIYNSNSMVPIPTFYYEGAVEVAHANLRFLYIYDTKGNCYKIQTEAYSRAIVDVSEIYEILYRYSPNIIYGFSKERLRRAKQDFALFVREEQEAALVRLRDEAVKREKILPIIESFKEETSIPAVFLTAKKGENLSITDSKIGGTPYRPKGFVYPTSSDGAPMFMLAQINFAQMPTLEHFPQSGILQFYISLADVFYGSEDSPNQGDYRVIYHENTNDAQDTSKVPEGGVRPFDGEFALTGTLEKCPMSPAHYKFHEKIMGYFEKHGLYEDLDYAREMAHDSLFVYRHMISSYPFFTQEDPRGNNSALEKFDTQLFQLTTDLENGLCWGDSGVLNFHIPLQNLKKLDFSEIMYNFDCY